MINCILRECGTEWNHTCCLSILSQCIELIWSVCNWGGGSTLYKEIIYWHGHESQTSHLSLLHLCSAYVTFVRCVSQQPPWPEQHIALSFNRQLNRIKESTSGGTCTVNKCALCPSDPTSNNTSCLMSDVLLCFIVWYYTPQMFSQISPLSAEWLNLHGVCSAVIRHDGFTC